MVKEIKVGCCGLAGLSLSEYSKMFRVIELQYTFYKLPLPDTAAKWRNSVAGEFEFTLKAFQGITHPISSPTWRRAGSQKPKENQEAYGHLQLTKENFECWRKTLHISSLLRASFCVINLPPSFSRTEENAERLRAFFKERKIDLGIEFRHPSWFKDAQRTSEDLKEIGAVHIVDPLTAKPIIETKIQYFRLHGLGARPYVYRYSEDDLRKLSRIVDEQNAEMVYIMFNNISMREDAERFLKML
jgi:uncharacterized protein YecE (DUF72 family)